MNGKGRLLKRKKTRERIELYKCCLNGIIFRRINENHVKNNSFDFDCQISRPKTSIQAATCVWTPLSCDFSFTRFFSFPSYFLSKQTD